MTTHTELTVIPVIEHPIFVELRTSLARYERMAAPPRHLQFPLVGCGLANVRKAQINAARRGDAARWAELVKLERREAARICKLESWTDRSPLAWRALALRLGAAMMAATISGLLVRGSQDWSFASARYRDAIRRANRT